MIFTAIIATLVVAATAAPTNSSPVEQRGSPLGMQIFVVFCIVYKTAILFSLFADCIL